MGVRNQWPEVEVEKKDGSGTIRVDRGESVNFEKVQEVDLAN